MIGGAKGIGIGIDFGIPNQYCRATSKPYIEKDVLDSLRVVASAYGKSNNDADRSIVKNLVDASNPFVISNAAFKLNSGFGKYSADFESFDLAVNISQKQHNKATISLNGRLCNHAAIEVDEMKVNIIGNVTELIYWYIANPDDTTRSEIRLTSGINTLPKSYAKDDGQTYNIGFAYISGDSEITIEQIPSFEGAFVTDGIDDLITSTKTVQEMLGGSNEITVVSMTHKLSLDNNWTNLIGELKGDHTFVANRGINTDKTGIYGYTYNYNENAIVINNILGDKNDYIVRTSTSLGLDNKYYVTGFRSAGIIQNISQIAWYWTFIANRVLTTDEINQVIAYYNLDRTLKPDILCDVKKQGITNENHAEFGDKLIDFSGNGRDIQLNNIAWKGDSGIGKYEMDFLDWVINSPFINERTSFTFSSSNDTNNDIITIYQRVPAATQSFLIKAKLRGRVLYRYYVNNGDTISISYYEVKEGINILPDSADPTSVNGKVGFILKGLSSIKLEQIPSHAGALCLDGINDFGKVTGMPVYKDYTIVVDYERISGIEQAWAEALISKSYIANQGAFVLMETNETAKHSYSFGAYTTFNKDDSTRTLLYQSKYKCGDVGLNAGTGVDGDTLWLGTYRDNYSSFFNGAIYSLMSFPYSMSEFLIERQLKKHKLGTLYPDMVEFRPIVKSNLPYSSISYSVNPGEYISVDSMVTITVTLPNTSDKLMEVSCNAISDISISGDNGVYEITGKIVKSPQKINITIDEYIRYEDIVQPYPVLLRFNDENGNEVSWGGKFRVGSTITRIGSAADSNLLPNIYNIFGLLLNDNQVTSSKVIVEKTMVFKAKSAYIFDNNEPKCILSPSRLRIPNSSYKLLGYSPDISGHGNHGVIHNSAYAEGSGVNEDGSYQFDGVDDFVTIPTITGGKQVLMKVNWQSITGMAILYDQRTNGGFAIFNRDYDTNENKVPAYRARNIGGNTYIDGILNEYIYASQLQNITHNIVELYDPELNIGTLNPKIGSSYLNSNYAQMSLYDFMLFDKISTDDKIKELNEYVGIEAKVELPPYYWDAYGKTNLDADKATIQQRGVAIGDYDLINNNFAYEGMSGYNGYPAVFGTNKTYANLVPNDGNFILTSSHNIINVTKFDTSYGLLYSHIKLDGKLTSRNIDYPSYKIKVTGLGENFGLHYSYLESSSDTTVKGFEINNDGTYIIPKSFASDGSLTSNSDWIGFIFTGTAPESCNVTIEVLPEYENGLVYDGVDDYSKNENIPVLTDYTIIAKRLWINKDNPLNEQFIHKGAINTPISESAFMLEYEIANDTYYRSSSYGGYINIERSNRPERIVYQTSNSYNGTSITKGSGTDTTGIVIGGVTNNYWNGVFYKLMLYSKTLPLLQINYLKNLMEKDEIIDLNNPIFIQ